MDILERGVSSSVCAGVTRYELAQLRDIEGYHVAALRLHAANREDYPRFWRGRYRLGMSLEMIANPEFRLHGRTAKETLCECLSILDRCRVTQHYEGRDDDIKRIKPGKALPRTLRMKLLAAAQAELRAVRQKLTPWRITWAAFVHRDERAIWKHYWRLEDRQRFHDAARVAELLVGVRQCLNEQEGHTESGSGQHQDGLARKVSCQLRRVMDRYNLARARWITAAIAGDSGAIKAVLKSKDKHQIDRNTRPRPHARRTRRVPWQHSTPSWQAAYNTACLYAALAARYDKDTMTLRVITSLNRAINDRHCEMGRPSDWIERDPDFSSVRSAHSFKTFFHDLKGRDYPR